MPKNLILLPKTARDIDQRIERVLRGLGNPNPPLQLDNVRELLKLDLAFYTAEDPGITREVISRIRVATIQLYQRPTLLIDVIKKMSLKALYLPDQKRILLDRSLPILKHRWNAAHEISHSLLPWHEPMMHGDNDHTLSRDCHEKVEAEANFAAGRLLFLRDRFTEDALSQKICFDTVRQLKTIFGNTLSTTLYRYVESIGADRPAVGIIAGHPHILKRSESYECDKPCRHVIQSPAFSARFSLVTEVDLFQSIAGYCGSQSGGYLGMAELILNDDNGDQHRFCFETFFNQYDSLTLGVYIRPEPVRVAITS